MNNFRNILTLGLLLMFLAACNSSGLKHETDIDRKVNDLLFKMTLDEKIGQMSQMNGGAFGSDEGDEEAVRQGRVGSFLNVFGAERVNKLQRIAIEESRLGIPLIIGRDVIHGYRTIFPIPLGMASSWDPDLVEKAMRVSAIEASSMGINWTFAPMIDVTWDPRWGRIAESCGEDPYLTSQFATAMIEGLQGDFTDRTSIAACAKHFIGYGKAEAGRDYNTTYIPEPLLRNVHLKPFEAAVEADALTFMSAFNDLNGVPTSGNEFTLKKILRDEWNYDGFVVSDWGSIEEMIAHGYAANQKQAAEIAVKAGVDMEMASTTYFDFLKILVEEGKIDEQLIDEKVANILRVKMKLGLFDHPYVDENLTETLLSEEHLQLARKVAANSFILLKNKSQALPLNKSIHTVAVIGPMANAPHDQMGTWVFDGNGDDSHTPVMAFREYLGQRMIYADGLEYSRDNSTDKFKSAISAANQSDAIIYFVGEESCLSGEANARGIIDLPGKQSELLVELKKTGKPLIMVVMAGRPLAIGKEIGLADAVLYAWHPGTMAGPALVDVVFGDVVPSGKLPVTMVKGAGQIPFYYYRKNTGRPSDPNNITLINDIPRNSKQLSLGFSNMHIDYGITPLYPFGYGLSYTTFDYKGLQLSSNKMSVNGEITVSIVVSNTGNYEAKETVQLYVRDLVGSITRPIKELKGFQKIHLKPGESSSVEFSLKAKDLEFFNGKNYVIEPGDFDLWVGPNSAEGLKTSFVIE